MINDATSYLERHDVKNDLQIKQDIIDEFFYDPSVDPTDIGVTVDDGIVTLTGKVATLQEKLSAQEAARRIRGVKAVAVDITVMIGKEHVRDDTEIAKAVERMLSWNSSVPADRLQVLVEDGLVTITGDVDWAFQRKAAVKTVSHLLGVRGVHDKINIRPAASPNDIAQQIETALKRQVEHEAHQIEISLSDRTVTLRGSVRSEAERRAVVKAAHNATGVIDVVDELVVGPV